MRRQGVLQRLIEAATRVPPEKAALETRVSSKASSMKSEGQVRPACGAAASTAPHGCVASAPGPM